MGSAQKKARKFQSGIRLQYVQTKFEIGLFCQQSRFRQRQVPISFSKILDMRIWHQIKNHQSPPISRWYSHLFWGFSHENPLKSWQFPGRNICMTTFACWTLAPAKQGLTSVKAEPGEVLRVRPETTTVEQWNTIHLSAIKKAEKLLANRLTTVLSIWGVLYS